MKGCHHDQTSPVMDQHACGADGALDRMLRLGTKPKCVPAIFIHAGAGFHSHQNEHVHLQACVAAAEMGMKFLKAGATATEAIEASLRILEDKEITNAGYGSNLSIDGTVECDATIVDHLGRSGACGAVPNIRNPISLAKLILDRSNKPLSLRRVPPNALVGDGARGFAEEHGLATFSNDYLVSKNARDRYLRWQEDLKRADFKSRDSKTSMAPGTGLGCVPCQYDTATPPEIQRPSARDYAAAVISGTWNEGQPDSPYVGTPVPTHSNSSGGLSPLAPTVSSFFRVAASSPVVTRASARATSDRSPFNLPGSANAQKSLAPSPFRARSSNGPSEKASEDLNEGVSGLQDSKSQLSELPRPNTPVTSRDSSASPRQRTKALYAILNNGNLSQLDIQSPRGVKRSHNSTKAGVPNPRARKRSSCPSQETEDMEDLITDTIGAIAVDERGQIAAGSSSGGIGMKHRGRLGPAALVGIGTAVVPADEDDEDEVAVAAVTSGTGEHMATTMASQRCAERIYHGTRRGRGGVDIRDDDDDAVMESFITNDFMNHPGVKNCHSSGAIGVMAVKKGRNGYYLYFAHNTESFALASMGGNEREARCTMSRLPDGAKIAQGGRKIRVD